jgi:hypothetical protein
MIDYRLFYPQMSLDDQSRSSRRPLLGHIAQRIHQLPNDRRNARTTDRR